MRLRPYCHRFVPTCSAQAASFNAVYSVTEALVGALAERGVDPAWVRFEGGPVLPAMYGVGSRAWDLVVVKDDLPLAAITFAAMNGATIGNNLNNRVHQLTSIAHDVRAAYAGPEQSRIQPYLGAFRMEKIMRTIRTRTSLVPL